MALTRSEVEKYIGKVEGRLNSPHERNLKGLTFAELYRKAGKPELAKRYLLAYISANSNDYRAHKFLGELLEDAQDDRKALESYKRSLVLNNDQNDVLLKIVKLYTELKIDPKIAKAWADRASKQIPGHPAIFDLQVHLIELKKPLDYDELINLVAEELTQRPHESSVHAKLVETYIKMDHIEDAYDHCVSVNKTKAFHKNLPWFVLTVNVLERYLELKESQVRNHSPVPRQSILQEIYIVLLTTYCNLVELNLSQSTLRKSSKSLLRVDQLLYQAINLDNGLSNSTDLSEASEWDVAITEIRAQLYMLSGHLILRLAKEGYSAWSKALEMATACYATSYRVSEPEMASSWVAKASRERNPVIWSIMAASRLSQTGHLILATLDRYGEEKIDNILLNLCSPQGQEDILTTLYGHNNDFSKLFLSEDESFLTPEFIVPGQLKRYDEVFIAENPLNLQLIVWIGLQWYQHGQETKPGIEILVSQMFDGLRMDVRDMAQCAADFVSLRDVEAFIYAVIKCSAHEVFEDLDVVYEYYQPKLLPLCLCEPLCIPTQTEWWNAVYTLFTGTVSLTASGKAKMIVQRGLEQIRTLKNQGMHPKLVIHLASNFGQKSLLLKDAAGYSPWHYSTHWKSFQLRSLHYWNVALSLFEDMKRNKNPGSPKDPLFPHKLSHLEEHDVHRYFREACMTLGEAAVEQGDFEHALNLFNRVESSHAAWNEAQIFKHLAGVESSNAGVDDRAYDSYIQYLNEAKDRLLLCLERLEYDKVVRDAVEEELAALESRMNERKSFYHHVDPRKSIDFHQLDFDALRSPVCSDITESGEAMSTKEIEENETRELLATVSEVTLDNGFLREQVSIRDEQVLRLSRQVQELQSELARFKQNGDMSPASFSFPSERTPSPLEDYESPKVQLETGEKFTRQGIFVNNMVVPTERCDDPSFFSGLSKSNTPDRIQSVLDEDEEESDQESDGGDDIYFEPIVQLPSQVELRSGEEDEAVIFEERAKLFRFDTPTGEWKERGIGNIKLLLNTKSGQARILMRREKVLKICANHFLTEEMTLQPGKGSDRSLVWSTLADVSDDETKPEKFAAKFQTKEIAEIFKAKFDELKKTKPAAPNSPAHSPFAANPLATKPNPDHVKMPDLSLFNFPYMSSRPNDDMTPTKPVFNLQSFTDDGKSTESTVEPPFSSATFAAPSQKSGAADFWNQPQLFPGNPNMPFFQLHKPSDNLDSKEPEPFPAPHSASEQTLTSSSSHPQNLSTFSFTFSKKPEASTSDRFDGTFGDASEKESLSFQDLASNDGTGFKSAAVTGAGFTGKPLFLMPDNERDEVEDIEHEANIEFKPIVSLPLVKNRATGEEGEVTRFSHRAKLFRFDPAVKEWKERGLGEIKLLYDSSSGKSRVVMRRDQIHKVCANHFISPAMKLKANTTSNRSWLWHTPADVSDGEPKAEQLAVKFKQEETASEFKQVFEELQSISPTSKASDPDADQDTSTNTVTPSQFSDLKLQFQPPVGSWACDTCLVQNAQQSTQCAACQTPKPGADLAKPTQPFNNAPFSFVPPSSFSFGLKTPASEFSFDDPKPSSSRFTFGEQNPDKQSFTFSLPKSNNDSSQNPTTQFGSTDGSEKSTFLSEKPVQETSLRDLLTRPSLPADNLKLAFQPAEGSWECDTCLVRNTSEARACVACETPKPGAQPAVTNNLKFPFQPAEGSWECDTCLVRNTSEATACVACETPKPGAQPAVTNPGFNSNTNTSSGFNFCPSDGTTTGFSFGPSDANKDSGKGSGFSFGPSDASKDPTKGPTFSFGPSDANKDSGKGSGFSFGPSDVSKDPTKRPTFSFGPNDANKDSGKGSGFNFGPSDVSKNPTKGPTFSFVPSDASQEPIKGSGFNFGANNARKDPSKGTGFSNASLPTDAVNAEAVRQTISVDVDDTDSDETDSDIDSESGSSEEFSINSHAASREDSLLKLPTSGGATDLSEKDLQLIFKHPTGSWECETCLIQNAADVVKCVACETPKPIANVSGESALPVEHPGLKEKFQGPEGSWDCDICMVRNNKQSSSCVACQAAKPGTEQTKPFSSSSQNTFAFGGSFPTQRGFGFGSPATTGFKFGDNANKTAPEAGKDGETTMPEFNVPASEGFTFGSSLAPKDTMNFGTAPNEKTGSSQFSFGSEPVSKDTEETSQPVFSFGDKQESSKPTFGFGGLGSQNANKGFSFGSAASSQTSQSEFSFGNISENTNGGSLQLDKSDETKKKEVDFKNPPQPANVLSQGAFTFRLDVPKVLPMTSSSNKDLNVSADNPEKEDERVVFQPIVSLPSKVDVKTGEEDETTIFSGHAKLYRFTDGAWKERGVGEIKVLYDPNRKRGRIIMRRDQVHVLCANHCISKDMNLKPQGSSNKSWVWHSRGDFAEGEVKEQLFAVKFGDKDTALAFKDAFEECLDDKVSLLDEVAVENEVVVVDEVSVTEEQLARATKLLLPPNFYAYENQTEASAEEPEVKQHAQETSSVVPARTASELAPEPQSFTFGSADITSLSFNALASGLGTSPAFGKPSPNKGFTGAGSQLFGQETNKDDEDPEREVSGVDFKPIVQLEKIEQSSGEENEDVVYCERAKLYRYDKDTGQWRERGVGNLKLLKHKTTGQVRVVMRRDQILKLCANHFLTADMELKANAGSDRSWVWHTSGDVSDGEPKAEQLAAKFKNADMAQEFKEKFKECQEGLGNASESGARSENVAVVKAGEVKDVSSSGDVDSTTDDTGSLGDESDDTNAEPGETDRQYIAGEMYKEEQVIPDAALFPSEASSSLDNVLSPYTKESHDTREQTERKEDTDNLSERERLVAGLSLPLSSSNTTPSKDTTHEQGRESRSASSQRNTRTPSSSARSPPREILSSIDEPSPSNEPVTRVNFNFHSIVSGRAIYTGLDEETISPPETVDGTDKTVVVKALFPDTDETKNDDETEPGNEDEETDGAAESNDTVNVGDPVFKFGSNDISTLSFASLANQPGGFANRSVENKGFSGSGQQLFNTTSNDDNGDDDDPEREVEGTDFKPIVSLPDNIEQKTGEEDETVVYTHRAKLYRYDVDTKQWKERGVGDIKILLHNETKRCRIVMRREQIRKLCANHYITPGMELKENAGSDRSWVWSVDADFADGVGKNELLAVRFKHREDAVMFRDKFIECQEKLPGSSEVEENEMKISASEVSSVEEKPSDDSEDDVVITFEKVPSAEQKERAQLYELPETFYCVEQELDSEKEDGKTCDEDVGVAVDVPSPSEESITEKEDTTPIFQFGSKTTSTLSFAEVAQQTSGFSKTSEGTWKAFSGSGQQLFNTASNDDNGDDDDPEREVEGTEFKPIVSLPDNIEQKTGEEDETVVYTHRAKLFRYDVDTKQWKERGVGDIKILLHNETKRCRVVMRREQIRKLCANHYITPGMKLKENAGSDRSWVWSVDADFADGVGKNELLAVRFKHSEDAVMFRDKFIECQEKLPGSSEVDENEMKISASEVSSVEEKPSDDSEDDVVITFEKVPATEQKERAQLYELPETFYCVEQGLDSENEVEKILDEVPAGAVDVTSRSEESVTETEDTTPIFQFGSKMTSTLSFAEVAQQTSGFSKTSEGTWKAFGGSGQQLFNTASNDDNGDDDDPEREVEGTEFKPIVSLPDNIEQKTGEEDETVVYTHRAKLFRYDVDTKQWKERGVGDIKILLHNETKRCRIVMRREQIRKLCANHYITPGMELKENAGSDRSWVWSVDADFADGVGKNELLAVRFKHREDAVMFRDKFIECQEKLPGSSEVEKNEMKISASEVSSVEEKPSDGSEDDVVITFEKVPSAEQKERAQLYKLPETFHSLDESVNDKVVESESNFQDKPKKQSTVSKMDNVSVHEKEDDQKDGNVVGRSVQSNDNIIPAECYPKVAESFDCDKPKYKLNVVDESPSNVAADSTSTTSYTHSFVFGSHDISSLTFSSLVGTQSGFKSSPKKEFTGAGSQLFVQESSKKDSGDDDTEREVSGVDFKPIVQLEKIEQSSGEENEDVVYCERAKLYRYDKDTGQWRERGVGNLKLLKHKTTGQVRVVMRRDQILKLCANHFLTADMELKANAGSDRSWLWHTSGDVSDGEPKAEQLAARFKNADLAQEFKENFDMCKEELKASMSEKIENVDGKESVYETKHGAFRLRANDHGEDHESTLKVTLRTRKWANITPDNSNSSSVASDGNGDDAVTQVPETPLLQKSQEEKSLVHVDARDPIAKFYTDYLPRLGKVDVEESRQGLHVLFSRDAEVYFFDEDEDDWRDRGYGTLQILRFKSEYHIFMIDHVKICVAHEITPAMDLKPNAGSDRSWVWFTLEDHSDTLVVARELAAEFQSVEHLFEFKRVFDDCRDACGVPHEGHVQAMAASFDSNTHKLPSHDVVASVKPVVGFVGLWRICADCKVENSVDNASCLVCGKHFAEDITVGSARKPKIKIKHESSTRKFKKPIPTPKHILAKEPTVKIEKYTPVTQWWKCTLCGVENSLENSHCVVCKLTQELSPKTITCSPEISEMLNEISKK